MKQRKKRAFTLMEIMMVVAIIALLAAVGIPSFLNAREGAGEQVKEVNISTINAAKEQWAIINNKSPGATVTWEEIEDYVSAGTEELSDLDVDGVSITLNKIGISAEYE